HTDVARGNVGVLAEVAVQLRHEALAEAHDLAVGTTVRVEVRSALGAADALAGQCVLEDLLEAEELDDAQVHARVKTKSALVRAEGRVVLNAVTAVDLHRSVVIDPRHAKHDLPLRLNEALNNAGLEVFGVTVDHGGDRLEDLAECLVELGLAS